MRKIALFLAFISLLLCSCGESYALTTTMF